jgi:NAD(P)-dependent dehydrogenase (short-subunit alcohol dehydrogenase family)
MGIAVVTGANRGLGLALVRQLRARSASVVAVCRSSSVDLDRLGVRVESGIDLTSPRASVELATRFAHDEINLLIHNAGLLIEDTFGGVGADEVCSQLEINALAPLLLAQALTPFLVHGAKVALITSRMGSIGDSTSGGYYGYRMSKAALNAAGVSMARDFAPRAQPRGQHGRPSARVRSRRVGCLRS